MNEPASNRARIPVLKVRSKCASEEQLVVQFRKDLDPRGIFIKTRKGLPVGTQLRFEYLLEGGDAVIGGSGTVAWAREVSGDEGPAGMAVSIERVHQGAALLDRAAAERKGTRSRYERGLPRQGSSLPPPISSNPPSSLRPTAPPPEIEVARVTLPPGEEITRVAPPPSGAPPVESPPPSSEMPKELDGGIFRGVGPAPEDEAHASVEAAIASSQQAVDAERAQGATGDEGNEDPTVPRVVPTEGGPVSLPERPTDWMGPAVGVLFALFVGAAIYVAVSGGLPEPLQELLFGN